MTRLSRGLASVARWLAYGLIFLIPLVAIPSAPEPLEIHKQTVLVVLTLCAFLAWACSMVARRSFSIRAGWIHAVPLLVLGATVASAAASPAPYLSWIGGSSQEYMSALTIFALTVLYYVVVNVLASEREHRVVHALLLSSAAIAGAVGLWSAFHGDTFNTVGTLNALGIYLVAMTAFGCGLTVANRSDHAVLHGGLAGRLERALVVLVSLETVALLAIVNYRVLWILLIAGTSTLLAAAFFRAKEIVMPSGGTPPAAAVDQRRLVLPMLLLVVSAIMVVGLPFSVPLRAPIEVTPSFASGIFIASSVLGGPSALLGSGPGTYAFDYMLLRDAAVNATPMWAKRFDRAASFELTVATSLGIVGSIAWTIFVLAFFLRSAARVIVAKSYKGWATVLVDFSAWLVFVIAAFLYPGNLTLVFFLFVLAALMTSQTEKPAKEIPFATSPRTGTVLTVSIAIASVGVLAIVFVTVGRYVSESALAKAIEISGESGDAKEIVAALDRAVASNRFNDVAERDLAQALVMRVGAEIDGIADVSTISPEKKAYVQALAAAGVDASIRATDLSPREALNWLSQAVVYRALIPLIPDAGNFAVAAGRRAIALEPSNPSDQIELGKTFLALGESLRESTVSTDPAVAADAKQKLSAYLSSAEDAFNAAIALKPDDSSAHYQLSLTYDREGRLSDAITKMESVRKYNPIDVGVAFQLGMLYLRRDAKEDLTLAQKEFERAVELTPSYSNARWFLATIYEKQENVAGAIEQVSKVLEYNPGNEIVGQRLERLVRGEATAEVPSVIDETVPSTIPLP